MKTKRVLLILIAVLLMFSGCATQSMTKYDAAAAAEKFAIPDYSDKDGKLNILAFCGPSYNWKGEAEQYQFIKEAGYNLVIPSRVDFGSDSVGALQYLDFAEQAGLQVIVIDSALTEDLDTSKTSVYKEHPAFYGVLIADEPQEVLWPHVKDVLDLCIELFGTEKLNYVNTCDLRMDELSLQYDKFFEAIPDMPILSYDGYCMIKDGSVRSQFYKDAAIAKYKARQWGEELGRYIPVCNYILITGHWDFRNCSTEDIRWQTMSMLSYGYDYIGHYSYEGYMQLEDEGEAMINFYTGEKTDLYYKVQKVNNEVRAWENIYTSFNWQGTAPVYGEPDSEELCKSIPDGFFETEIPGINNINTSQNIVCGIFKDNKQNMGYMITNAINPFKEKAANMTIKFDSQYKGVMIIDKDYATKGAEYYGLNGNNEIKLRIGAGEGKFLIPLKLK